MELMKGAESLIVKNGSSRNFKKQSEIIIDEYNNYSSDDYLYMNGSEIFLFTLSAVPKLVNNTLVKNNIAIDEIDLFVFHQANRFMLDNLREKIKHSKEKFYLYLEDCGNTVSSTIPIALYHAQKNNLMVSGKQVLLAGFGVGYSWAGTVLKIK